MAMSVSGIPKDFCDHMSEGWEYVTNSCHEGLEVTAKVIKSSKGQYAIAKLVTAVADLAAQIFVVLTAALRDALGIAGDVIDVGLGFSSFMDLITGKAKGWLEKSTAISFVAAGIFGFMKFLDKVGHTAIGAALGAFPVLNLGMGGFALIGFGFDIANTSKSIHFINEETQLRLAKKDCWETMETVMKKLSSSKTQIELNTKLSFTEVVVSYETVFKQRLVDVWTIENSMSISKIDLSQAAAKADKQWQNFIDLAETVELKRIQSEEEPADYRVVMEKISHETKKYTFLTERLSNPENRKVEMRKKVISLITAVSKVAVIVLGVLGAVAAAGFIASSPLLLFTSPLFLTVAAVAATMAFVKVIYENKHDQKPQEEDHCLNNYRKNHAIAMKKFNRAEKHHKKRIAAERSESIRFKGEKPVSYLSNIEKIMSTPVSKIEVALAA